MSISFGWMIVLLIAASCQLTETIRHGSILENLRARIEARGPRWAEWISCGFCFSHTTAAICVFLLFGRHLCWQDYGFTYDPFLAILLWLAVIRGSNLLNDLTKPWSRTPSQMELSGLSDQELGLDPVERTDGHNQTEPSPPDDRASLD